VFDHAGAHRREPYPGLIEFGAQAVAEHEHCGLAGGVCIHRLLRRICGHRGDVDDVPAGAAIDEAAAK